MTAIQIKNNTGDKYLMKLLDNLGNIYITCEEKSSCEL